MAPKEHSAFWGFPGTLQDGGEQADKVVILRAEVMPQDQK